MIPHKKQINIDIPNDVQVPYDYHSHKENVKYGTIENIDYQANGKYYKAQILLPPQYNCSMTYPTLYLLSGLGNNYEWLNQGRIDYLIGNLGGTVRDTIIVMPEILRDANEPVQEKVKDYTDLEWKIPCLIDCIEQTYSVLKDRESRAIAGLSMGGMSALYLALAFDNTPYAISTVGAISPTATLFEWWLDGKEDLPFSRKDSDYNFCLATGTRDAILTQGAKRYQKVLKAKGLGCSFFTIQGKGHGWNAFTPLFYLFFKYYFKR